MDKPRLVGDGPASASTCLDLVRTPEWIADVNGYYRDLGVDPRATRGQISRAYRERGLNDAHLTFVVKQLLNPVIRRAYDLTPLGHVFLDEEVVRRIRHTLVRRMSGARGTFAEQPEGSDSAGFLRVVDKISWSEQGAPRTTSAWPYAHYLWGTDCSDAERLQRWQGGLTVALGRAGIRTQISVGIMGGPQPEFEVTKVGSRTVIFFHEKTSSIDTLVLRAVSQLSPEPSYTPQNRDRKMSTKPQFRKGTDEAKEASKGTSFARTHYFSLDGNPSSPNNSAIIRFLTEHTDLIVVDQHNNIPTKSAPKDYEGTSWPQKMSAVCRKDKAFAGMYDDCFICDHVVDGKVIKRPSARSWAYAVLREEVVEDGEILGYRDVVREVAKVDDKGKPTGETYMEKAIVVVNMGYKNFFSIVEGFGKHFKTLLDRDYLIKRNGTDTDTTYNIIPMNPIPMDEEGTIFDLRNPEFADRYKPAEALEDLVADRAADEFYARFFDTRVTAPASNRSSGEASTASAPERPSADASPDRLKALADRVKTYAAPSTDASADEAPAEAPDTQEAEAPKAAPKAAPKKSGGMRNFD